jgi:hypothetical protein
VMAMAKTPSLNASTRVVRNPGVLAGSRCRASRPEFCSPVTRQ